MERRILLAVDGSKAGFQAVTIVGQVLKDQPDVGIFLLHCVQQISTLMPSELCLDVQESCRLPFTAQEQIGKAVLDEGKRLLLEAGIPEARIERKAKLDSVDPAQDIMREAEVLGIDTIVLGRRGKSQIESLLLGSVSGKVAQYAKERAVWIVDAPVHMSQRALVAMQGEPDSKKLTGYIADHLARIAGLKYTFMHIMPPVPPTFWDDGHILAPVEQKDRQGRIEKWASEWIRGVEQFMSEARDVLVDRGVPRKNIETVVLPTKEGVARDLLNEISAHEFQMVVMGKQSFHERKPFLMGSHANKVLQNASGAILCLVDA